MLESLLVYFSCELFAASSVGSDSSTLRAPSRRRLSPNALERTRMMISSHAVMALITLWIGFLEWGSKRLLSNFAARKLCHAGVATGLEP